MRLARVVGTVVATVKDPGLHAERLLVVQPVSEAGRPVGPALVAVDGAGVGVGEDVFVVRGREASYACRRPGVPADLGIVGKVDAVDGVRRASGKGGEG